MGARISKLVLLTADNICWQLSKYFYAFGTNFFHTKCSVSSFWNDWIMAILVFWQLLTAANRLSQLSKLFCAILLYLFHIYFHAKCHVPSFKNGWVMAVLVLLTAFGSWQQVLTAVKNIFYLYLILISFMKNFEFLAHKITEL